MNIEDMESIRLPAGVSMDNVKRALQGGHGYEFFLIVQTPRCIEIGVSAKNGLPQLALLGTHVAVEHTSSQLIRQMLLALEELNLKGGRDD